MEERGQVKKLEVVFFSSASNIQTTIKILSTK